MSFPAVRFALRPTPGWTIFRSDVDFCRTAAPDGNRSPHAFPVCLCGFRLKLKPL
jgi:hypothetical protein